MIDREKDIKQKITETLGKNSFGMQDVQTLALCWSALQVFNDNIKSANNQEKELKDLFPALEQYQTEHNEINLKKLCVEIVEFCNSVYASTKNEIERNIYFGAIDKIIKK